MNKTSPMQSKPLVDVTCKLGTKGCYEDGRCHALGSCENKIVTNADRIRAMSDEEMAAFLRWDICTKVRGDNRLCNGWCDECVLEWLKQPAKEETK